VDLTAVVFEPGDDSHPPVEEMPLVLSRDTPLWPTVKPVAPAPVPAPPAVTAPPALVPPPPTPPPPPPGAEADVKTRALRISEILGEATLTARPARTPTRPATPLETPAAASVPPPPMAPPAAAPAPAEPLEPFPHAQEPVEASAEPAPPRGRTLADLYFAQGHYAEALGIYDDLVLANPGDEELKRLRRDAEARLLPAARTPEAAVPDPGLGLRLARIRVLKQWLSVVQAR
jgi:hypothetical protein